jgi:hypothetical protein
MRWKQDMARFVDTPGVKIEELNPNEIENGTAKSPSPKRVPLRLRSVERSNTKSIPEVKRMPRVEPKPPAIPPPTPIEGLFSILIVILTFTLKPHN